MATRCNKLYVTECLLHKVVAYDDKMRLNGNVAGNNIELDIPGDRKILVPVDVKLKVSVDMSKIKINKTKRNDETIEIKLPTPEIEITSTRINHEQVKEFVSWNRQKFDEAEIVALGKKGVEEAVQTIDQKGLIMQSEASVLRQLLPTTRQMGYADDKVTVTFEEGLDLEILQHKIDDACRQMPTLKQTK